MKELLIRHLMPAPWAWLGIILFLAFGIANGQQRSYSKRLYQVSVTRTNGEKVTGILSFMRDSSIQILAKKKSYSVFRGFHVIPDSSLLHELMYSEIQKIEAIRTGVIKKGALIGFVTGITTGTLIALNETNTATYDPNCPFCLDIDVERVFRTPAILGGLGMLVGSMIGDATRKEFEVKSRYKSFDAFKNTMVKKGVKVK